METQELSLKSAGKRLYGLLETPVDSDKPIILLLHGLSNSLRDCPLIEKASEGFHDLGFPTFRFDYFGSGKSEGEFKEKTLHILVENTIDALNFLTSGMGHKKVGLWGRSFGAILGSVISDRKEIFVSSLLSTTIHTNTTLSSVFPKGQDFSLPVHGTGLIKGEPVLPKQFYEETVWLDALQREHLGGAKNVLIVQGTNDKTIYDMGWAKEIYEIVHEPKKLVYVEGATHAYTGFEEFVIKEVMDWFEKAIIV